MNLKFQLNHYLYEGFKKELSMVMTNKLAEDVEWEKLTHLNTGVKLRLKELDDQIHELNDSLQEVQRIQHKM